MTSDPILYLLARYEAEITDEWSGTGRLEEKLAPAKAAREHLARSMPAKLTDDEALLMEALDFGQFSQDMLGADGARKGLSEPVRQALVRVLTQMYERLYNSDSGSARSMPASSPADEEARLMLALVSLRRKHPSLVHPDQAAVRKFAAAMEGKMAWARSKGRKGWDDPQECAIEFLQQLLRGHLLKGDPVDVANFCMMLWNRGAKVVMP